MHHKGRRVKTFSGRFSRIARLSWRPSEESVQALEGYCQFVLGHLGVVQLHLAHGRPGQYGPGQVGLDEAGPRTHEGVAQVGSSQVSSTHVGTEQLALNQQKVEASRYRLTGDKLEIDLWYDSNNQWLALQSTTENGSQLRYQLKQGTEL